MSLKYEPASEPNLSQLLAGLQIDGQDLGDENIAGVEKLILGTGWA